MTASGPPPYQSQPQPYPYGPPAQAAAPFTSQAQQAPQAPQAPRPPADPNALPRLLAGIFGLLVAALVLVGSFLPQTSFEQVVDGKTDSKQTISAWSRSFDVEPPAGTKDFYANTHVARYGIPLSAGALVLLAGAGLAFAGARRSASPALRSRGRSALLVGSAGVAAAVWMLGMDVSATLSYEQVDGSFQTHYATGIGFWLLLAAGAASVVTLGLALFSARRRAAVATGPAGPPAGPYPMQPPPGAYGGPGPYGQQQSQPYPVQPPISQPFPAQQYPASQPFPAQQPPPSQPFPAQQPPPSQPFPAPEPQSPTEPNYQLPPLNPPNT